MAGQTTSGSVLHGVRLRARADQAPAVDLGLEIAGIGMIAWEDVEAGTVTWSQYFRSRTDARALAQQLRPLLEIWLDRRPRSLRLVRLRNRDWTTFWKRDFRTHRVSRRIVIKPAWESYRPAPGEIVVDLDIGMAFGTGRHPTTRACLRLLDRAIRAQPDASVVDIGCGSGILLVAAAKLGCHRVTGIDNDPLAVAATRANARRNRVQRALSCRLVDLARFRPPQPFDVVMANLFSRDLIDHAQRLTAMVSPTPAGRLILSGVLAPQYAKVRQAFRAAGFREEKRIRSGEWITACMVSCRHRRSPAVA